MQRFLVRVILLAILSWFLYRRRVRLWQFMLGVEGIRRLLPAVSLSWRDFRQWAGKRMLNGLEEGVGRD